MKWTGNHCYIKYRGTELFRLSVFQDREGTWRASLLDSRVRGYLFEERALHPMVTEKGARHLALRFSPDAIAARYKTDETALIRLKKYT